MNRACGVRWASRTSSPSPSPRSTITVAATRGTVAGPELISAPGSGRASHDRDPTDATRPGTLAGVRYMCESCGFIYDPAEGDPDGGIPRRHRVRRHPGHVVLPRVRGAQERLHPLRGLIQPRAGRLAGCRRERAAVTAGLALRGAGGRHRGHGRGAGRDRARARPGRRAPEHRRGARGRRAARSPGVDVPGRPRADLQLHADRDPQLDPLRSLGVDRLRLTILWSAIAPQPQVPDGARGLRRHRSGRLSAPAPGRRMTGCCELARARGIAVDFDLTAPGPRWAMRPSAPTADARPTTTRRRRWTSVSFVPAARAAATAAATCRRARRARCRGSATGRSGTSPTSRAGWRRSGAGRRPAAVIESRPAVPRAGRRRRTRRCGRTGHARRHDPHRRARARGRRARRARAPGAADPVPGRAVLRRRRSAAADRRRGAGAGCPGGGARAAFVAAHPGLFAATGFAHHPVLVLSGAGDLDERSRFVPLADLAASSRRSTRSSPPTASIATAAALPDRIRLRDRPAEPVRGVPPAVQAAYLDEAAYLAWRDPRVRAPVAVPAARLTARPRLSAAAAFATGRPSRPGWSTVNGAPKPALDDYRVADLRPRATFAPRRRASRYGGCCGPLPTRRGRAPGSSGARAGARPLAVADRQCRPRGSDGRLHGRRCAHRARALLRLAWTPPARPRRLTAVGAGAAVDGPPVPARAGAPRGRPAPSRPEPPAPPASAPAVAGRRQPWRLSRDRSAGRAPAIASPDGLPALALAPGPGRAAVAAQAPPARALSAVWMAWVKSAKYCAP